MAGPTGASTGRPSTPVRSSSPVRPATARRASPAATVAASAAQPSSAVNPPGPAVVVKAPAAPAPAPAPAAIAAPAAAPAPAAPREGMALLYGMLIVVAGFVAILIALLVVVLNYKVASDATAILGVVTTAIAGLGGAFFGVAIGQQGTASANKERAAAEAGKDQAQAQTIKFAANMDPAVGRRLVE